jgi:transcription elongation GreA/GreB family factor
MAAVDKPELKAELVAQLAASLAAARAAHRAATEGATDAEARPENDKDTRGLEQSYLARGQAARVAELEAELAMVEAMAPRRFAGDEPVGLGALVTVEEDGARRRCFLSPHGGGALLAGGAVQVVTPRSPLGRALIGKLADDEVDLVLPAGRRALTIVAIE